MFCKHPKLLIVDDELSVRDSLAKWFHEEGYEVGTAEDANIALDPCWPRSRGMRRCDDIKMRGTDGIELQRRMHEINPDLYCDHDDGLRLGGDGSDGAEERRL